MTINEDDLDFDGEVCLYKGQPFTGIVQAVYADGSIKNRSPYLDGFEQGVCREWHTNGQMKTEWIATHGIMDGEFAEWHENGRAKVVAIYKKGVEMAFDEWSEDGLHITHRVLDRQSDLWKYANG